jgi:hypothetical protein
MPWFLKEAIYIRAALDNAPESPPPTCLIEGTATFMDWLRKAREREERKRR